MFHGIECAFKIVKINTNPGQTMEQAKREVFEEFLIQRECAKPPTQGQTYLYDGSLQHAMNLYEAGMENLVLAPLAAFFLEDEGEAWAVFVTERCPMGDLEKFKSSNTLDHQCIAEIIKQFMKARQYFSFVRGIVHHDWKPSNILVTIEGNGRVEPGNIRIKFTDFGLAGDRYSQKRGGTPIYAPPEVFSAGVKWYTDCFSMGRTILFLVLDPPEFNQLAFFPILDQQLAQNIRGAIQRFWIFQEIKELMNPKNSRQLSTNMDSWNYSSGDIFSFLKIGRSELEIAGIDRNWFLDSSVPTQDSIVQEQFNLQNLE